MTKDQMKEHLSDKPFIKNKSTKKGSEKELFLMDRKYEAVKEKRKSKYSATDAENVPKTKKLQKDIETADGDRKTEQKKTARGRELSAKEAKQKAYFEKALVKEPEKSKTNAKEAVTYKIRGRPVKEAMHTMPAVSSAKYQISEAIDYERKQEYNGDEASLQANRQVAGAAAYAATYQPKHEKREQTSRRYKTEKEKKPKKKNSVGDIDLMIQEQKNFRKFYETKKAEQGMEQASDVAKKIIGKIKEYAENHKIGIIIAIFILLLFLAGMQIGGVLMEGIANGTAGIVGAVSPTTDYDMTTADNYFTELEAALQEEIDNIETNYPGYDVYVVDADEIGHDPVLLMAFLSAVYEGYDLGQIQSVLDALFAEMYTVTYEESITGEGENTVKTLTLKVVKKEWDELMRSRVTGEDIDQYDAYAQYGGGHQTFSNPFESNWSSLISSPFGWRIHPITGEEKFHNGVDIAIAEGTEIKTCTIGRVVKSYYSDSAGNYIIVEDELGYRVHYMHLKDRYVSEGDIVSLDTVIGTVGNTGRSTGPHLHLGITDASGEYLNPIFLVQGGI